MVAILVRCTVVTIPIVIEVVPSILPGPCESISNVYMPQAQTPSSVFRGELLVMGHGDCAAIAIK